MRTRERDVEGALAPPALLGFLLASLNHWEGSRCSFLLTRALSLLYFKLLEEGAPVQNTQRGT